MASRDEDCDAVASADLRSFGRRRGRKASARQRELLDTLLPRVAVDLAALAARSPPAAGSDRPLWLEIGFGGGEHLVWQASNHPGVDLIGCEPFEDGVVKVLDAIDRAGLGNIGIHADDARPLLRALPDFSVSRAFILFPDPWPKQRHRKRRLIQRPLVDQLARVMRPGGELRFASDIGDYVDTALQALMGDGRFVWTAADPRDWRVRPEDWPPTRYEQKAVREGRRCYYFSFRRT